MSGIFNRFSRTSQSQRNQTSPPGYSSNNNGASSSLSSDSRAASPSTLTRSAAGRYYRSNLSRDSFTDEEAVSARRRFTSAVEGMSTHHNAAYLADETTASTYNSLVRDLPLLTSSLNDTERQCGNDSLGTRGAQRDRLVSNLIAFSDRYEEISQPCCPGPHGGGRDKLWHFPVLPSRSVNEKLPS